MSLSLRPPESTGVSDDTRRRMEGRVESLEDALLLLDAVSRAVGRGVEDDDDVNTVREAISQLPRLDEHAAKLATVPDTEALVRRYTQSKNALETKLAAPSLRAGLTTLLERRVTDTRAPALTDTLLMDAPTIPSWLRAFLGVVIAVCVLAVTQSPLALLLFPGVWLLVNIFFPRDRWFAIEPHRLFMSGRLGHQRRDVMWSDVKNVERHGRLFIVKSRLKAVPVSPSNPELFASWVKLLTGPWLKALSSKKQDVVTLKGREDARGEDGVVFLTREGVLFLPDVSRELAARSLTGETLQVIPPWKAFVEALSHARNWSALGPHLATTCDGAWLERGSFTIEEADPTTVRLNGSTRANEETTGNRGRWSLVQLTLEPFKRAAALELLEATKAQAT